MDFCQMANYYRRTVTSVEASQFASENGALYVETSAKTALGVEEAFMRTVASAWEKAAKGQLVLRDSEVRPLLCLPYSSNTQCIVIITITIVSLCAASIFGEPEAREPGGCGIVYVDILLLI